MLFPVIAVQLIQHQDLMAMGLLGPRPSIGEVFADRDDDHAHAALGDTVIGNANWAPFDQVAIGGILRVARESLPKTPVMVRPLLTTLSLQTRKPEVVDDVFDEWLERRTRQTRTFSIRTAFGFRSLIAANVSGNIFRSSAGPAWAPA